MSDNFMGSDEKGAQLLIELSKYVADSLHTIYPEVGKNLTKVCFFNNCNIFIQSSSVVQDFIKFLHCRLREQLNMRLKFIKL